MAAWGTILNSKVVYWYYTKISSEIRGGFVRFIAEYVSQIPVPPNTKPETIEALVNKILLKKAKDPLANVSKLEHQIDLLVYELYGLTEDEKKIV